VQSSSVALEKKRDRIIDTKVPILIGIFSNFISLPEFQRGDRIGSSNLEPVYVKVRFGRFREKIACLLLRLRHQHQDAWR
jgi:hypothetical protein